VQNYCEMWTKNQAMCQIQKILPDDALLSLRSTVCTETAREAAVVTGTGIGAAHTRIALLVVHIITVQSVARVHCVVHVILGTAVAVRIIIIITVVTVERQMMMLGAEESGSHVDGTSSAAVRGGVVVLQHG